uniref:Uncharacterized protein n=1 Tax=viral metagenome TaxID=1070528 RepID=A0A6C0KPS2_9ZZZZ
MISYFSEINIYLDMIKQYLETTFNYIFRNIAGSFPAIG